MDKSGIYGVSFTDRGGCQRDGSGGSYVKNGNIYFTPEGGFAIKAVAGEGMQRGNLLYINATGANGNLWKTPVDSDMPIGTCYSPTAVAGDSIWATVAGIGYAFADVNNAPVRGYVVHSSTATRGVGTQSATLPSVAAHNREIGHFLESGSANVAAKIILHFN